MKNIELIKQLLNYPMDAGVGVSVDVGNDDNPGARAFGDAEETQLDSMGHLTIICSGSLNFVEK